MIQAIRQLMTFEDFLEWYPDDGWRLIGSPKQPTVSVYSLVGGLYELAQFRSGERVHSAVFPELDLWADQILGIAE